MGYSYSKEQSSIEDKQSSVQDQNEEHIYILFMNISVKTYHNNFDVCYKEAIRLCKNITFDLMMTYGASNYISFEEEFRDDGSCNIVIYCTPKNMLGNMRRRVDTVILIQKIDKLKPVEEDYTTTCTHIENSSDNITQEEESEEEESEIEVYNEHAESDDSNEETNEEKTE